MNTRLLIAPLLILSLDTVPAVVRTDSSSTSYRLGFGVAAGEYEYKHFDCDGNLVRTDLVKLRSGGGRIDLMRKQLRVSGFAGGISSDAAARGVDEYDGAFGGAQVAGEWRRIGLGAGAVKVSGHDGFLAPSLYLRLGNIARPHVRLDLLPPSETFGNTPWARAGIGFNQGPGPGVRGLFGLGVMPYSTEERADPRIFGELDLPVGRELSVLFRSQIGLGAEHTEWAVGGGMSIRAGAGR
jgi:hypothetical protein